MRKTGIIILTFFLLASKQNVWASPQLPDYLIFNGDTIPVYSLILEQYLEKINTPNQGDLFGLKFRGGASLNCWRGYQAIYSIENDSLFLKNVIDCGERKIDQKASDQRISEIFNNKVKNGKVYIDWFSGDFSLPNGELLRWDGVFHKTFENEILITVQKGKIRKISKIENYIDDPNRMNRKYGDTISKAMFNELYKLNWNNKKDFDCSEKYLVTIGKNGKVNKVMMPEYQTKKEIKEFWERNEYNYCIKAVLKGLQDLKFDILKTNGRPIEENIYLEIRVEDNGKLENWDD